LCSFGCVNGACQTGLNSCIDTDNGADIYAFGKTKKIESNGNEIIIGTDTIYGDIVSNYQALSYWVKEVICAGGSSTYLRLPCPTGANSAGGVCLNQQVPGCTDTDNGLNLYTKGTVTFNNVSYTDTSQYPGLKEYYCFDATGNSYVHSKLSGVEEVARVGNYGVGAITTWCTNGSSSGKCNYDYFYKLT
jgi:hypothetical protein